MSLQLWHSTALKKNREPDKQGYVGIFKFIPTCCFFFIYFIFFKKYPQAEHSARAVIKAIIILVKTSHSQYRCNLQQRSHTSILSVIFFFSFLYVRLCALDLHGFFIEFCFVLFFFCTDIYHTDIARCKRRNWSLNKLTGKTTPTQCGCCTYLQYDFWNVLPFKNIETLYRQFHRRNTYTF